MRNAMIDIALEGARLNAILISAIQHKLFDAIGDDGSTIEEIAERTAISMRGCQAIADGLVGLRIWRVEQGRYQNTPSTETLLCTDSKEYIGDHQLELFQYWLPIFLQAPDFVATGQPPYAIDSPETLSFWSHLTPMLARKAGKVAEFCIQKFEIGTGSPHLLDIGGGGAALYAKSLLSANEIALATQADWPHINDAALATIEDAGLADRFSRIDGDFHEIDFGTEDYDIVVMSNIIHQESPQSVSELIKRCQVALKPGGRLIISDWIVEDGRTGPNPSLFFNFTMLLLSEEGRTYEKNEISIMFKEAGLSTIEFLRTDDYETIVTGIKE